MEKDSGNTLTALAVDGGMSNSDLTMQVCFHHPSESLLNPF
jgi:glycerol kinase